MRLSDLTYELDPTCVAREPSEVRLGRRGLNRMLCVDRSTRTLADDYVVSLPTLLSPGDVVVVNNSRRSHGVLFGYFEQGGQVELRLVKQISATAFRARLFPQHFAQPGCLVRVADCTLTIEEGPTGKHRLYTLSSNRPIDELIAAHGLPITSFFYDGYYDLAHYNPVYASEEGSFESPMAGLHLSDEILVSLHERGIQLVHLTHHVVGSWLPPTADDIQELSVAEECYQIPNATSEAIARAKRSNRRVLAVGSTCMRALESAGNGDGIPDAGAGITRLCIKPGYEFKCVTTYLTSFHPARSSLMVLDAAFCELTLLREAYRHANDQRYMFLEFGDAVLYL